ncbi:phosphoglycerate kinase [Patescibacteria group bacterium]|nr:phosphoglycerate kinase [Patescibacteria group bacterium]
MVKYLSDQNLKKLSSKTCLLRIDLNVEAGMPLDSYRLEAVIPTIKLLLRSGAKVVLMSHRGRPPKNAESRIENKAFTLAPFGPVFAKKLKTPVDFIEAARLGALQKAVQKSTAKLVLIENLRFFKGEETNDPSFARELAKCGDIYVNDAFAVSHRANASVAAITKFLPSYAGLLMEKEIKNLGAALKKSERPLALIVGGAKVSDKLGVVKNFWKRTDAVIVGGGPANTFLQAEGMNVIDSLVDSAALSLIKPYLNSPKVHLPSDLKWQGTKILDIGPKTVKDYAAVIKKARTIIWNGPMGWFEKKAYAAGTKGVSKAVLANKKARIVIGGGETVTSLGLMGKKPRMGKNVFVLAGGGAMLDFLAGKKLPGIESLK